VGEREREREREKRKVVGLVATGSTDKG